jgi:hypothetical protein
MDDWISWFNRNKCALYKVGIAIILSIILVGVFAGTAATAGAGSGLAGLLVAKFGLGAVLAGILAKVLLILVSIGVSASRIGDFIVCRVFNIAECCHEEFAFWTRYGEFVEANGGGDRLTPAQCAELARIIQSFTKVSASDLEAIRRFLREHCDD